MLVKVDDGSGGQLGVVGDDGPRIASFLADDDTTYGLGGEIGIEVDGFDFGNPHPVFESRCRRGERELILWIRSWCSCW